MYDSSTDVMSERLDFSGSRLSVQYCTCRSAFAMYQSVISVSEDHLVRLSEARHNCQAQMQTSQDIAHHHHEDFRAGGAW